MAFQTTGLGFQLEAKETSSYPGSGNIWYDISGITGINATNYGAVFQSTSPKHFLFNNNDDSMAFNPSTDFKFYQGVGRGIGVWINLNETSATHTHPIISRKAGSNGQGWEFSVVNRNVVFKYNNGAINITIQSSNTPITLTGWHYIFVRYQPGSATTSVTISVDGAQVANGAANSVTQDTYNGNMIVGYDITRAPANFFPGKIAAIHWYQADAQLQTGIDNYNAQASFYATSTNVNITKTPATASALMVDSSISRGVNFEDTFRLATATFANPTLVIIENNNVEVVTAITVSAIMVEPFSYVGETNISNAADVMIASADKGTHDIVGGSGVSYPADQATATALFQYPTFFGQGDRLLNATVLTATVLMTTANVSVNPSYFHEIKKINPSLYFNGTTTNYGSTPATISLDNNWVRQADDAPLNYIFYDGNNHSYDYVNTVGGQEQMTISGASVASLLTAAHTNKQWTLEYWFKSNNAGTNGWNDGDSTPNRWVDFGNITIITNDYYATGNPNNPFANGFSITVQVRMSSGSYQITTPNLTNLAPSFNWNHFVLYQTGNTIAMFVNSVLILVDETIHTPANLETTLRFYPSTNESPGYASIDEIVYYDYPLTQPIIADHYNYIKNFDPSKIFYAESFDAAAEITETNVIAIVNKTIPATPITASILFVDPLVIASINLSNSATALTASADALEPSFYGNPDASIAEPSMLAAIDSPPNVYRLDTAYYSYVQTNIAPFRYVTFDVPNSNLDWGSDNDFGGATPFTYGGSISLSIDGLSNNSLLTNGTNYTTSGLIMKESEHDDNWGTFDKNWHTSFWIKKDHTDTNSNGLRIIANLHSYENNKHLIVYQYNNYLYLQLDDKVNTPQTFQSSVNVNVFDQNKHHIVITSKSDDKIQIYKNKILVLNATVANHVVTTNSASYLAPNTETNNRPRFSVGALITPYAETNLPATPTPSIMYIDEAHWAVTHIAQTGVNNLYNAMPFKVEIEWFADPALSNFSQFVEPTFGTGAGINAAPALITNATFVLPTISTEFSNTFNATALIANASAVEPFSVIADNITNIIFNAQSFIAGAMLLPAVTTFTVAGNTMYASAKIQYVYPYTDPYRVLILSQQYKQLTAEGFVEDVWVWKDTYTVGDLN